MFWTSIGPNRAEAAHKCLEASQNLLLLSSFFPSLESLPLHYHEGFRPLSPSDCLNPYNMNYPMKPVAAAKLNHCHQPLIVSVHHDRPFFSRPISFLSFGSQLPSLYRFNPTKVSYSNPSDNKNVKPNVLDKNVNPQFSQILTSLPTSFLKTTFPVAAAMAALFFCRLHLFTVKPVVAAPATVTVETTPKDALTDVEKEKSLEEHLRSHPNDVDALRNLMEMRIKNQKPHEAISIVEKLIELEPKEPEWPLMKSHLHTYSGEVELAKKGFSEIIAQDPFRVEAYHGLVMAVSQDDPTEELKEIEKRIQEAMKMCKKANKKKDFRDFKLLLAQIHVMEGNYSAALEVYQELVKEEPQDFRPYLCQGIIYTLLRKKDQAEKNFEKYGRLVPKDHPYARYFEENMIATKVFGQKMENERSGSTS